MRTKPCPEIMRDFYKIIIRFPCVASRPFTHCLIQSSIGRWNNRRSDASWITSIKVIVKSASKQAEMEIALIEMWHVAVALWGSLFMLPQHISCLSECQGRVRLFSRESLMRLVRQRSWRTPLFNYNTRLRLSVSPSFNYNSATHVAHST